MIRYPVGDFKMRDRTSKIIANAKRKIDEEYKHVQKEYDQNTTPISGNILLAAQVLDNALSPENFSELIDKAEIVFANSSSPDSRVQSNVQNNEIFPMIISDLNSIIDVSKSNPITSSNVITIDITSESQTANKEINIDFQTTSSTENSYEIIYTEQPLKMPDTNPDNHKDQNSYSSEHPGRIEKIEFKHQNSNNEILLKEHKGSDCLNYPQNSIPTSTTSKDSMSSGIEGINVVSRNSNTLMSSEDDDASVLTNNQPKKLQKKGVNNRKINQRQRMKGQQYLGFTKPKGQKNTFHNKDRTERQLGVRCSCKSKSKKLRCHSLTEVNRQRIFDQFWTNLNWDQRKIYVSNTIKRVNLKRPRKRESTEVSRRTGTLQYSLKVKNEDNNIPICKKMYLSTLCLGEWSVRNWVSENEDGLNDSFDNKVSKRQKRADNYEESREFLREFLETLNKLPSHYCRKDTKKMYLEQIFQSYTQLHRVYESKCQERKKSALSVVTLTNLADEMNIALFHPRKDQCDTCFKWKNKNLTEEEYNKHIQNKTLARAEKESDKQNALLGQCHVITMDVQAVKLAPQIAASALYYKTKLCCHNFTIYNLKTHQVTCYWYNEAEADGQAATYASFLVDYLQEFFLNVEDNIPIIIYSDGCTAQNRNAVMSNALLFLSEKYQRVICQKFLEKGHTQMECDSVHSAIETALKNKEIYLPSDYYRVTKEARFKNPYVVKNMDSEFFLNYGDKSLMKYNSIRPGKLCGPTVTQIRALQYSGGKIQYKLQFDKDYEDVPTRPKGNIDFNAITFPKLFSSKLSISKKKYEHLQQIKTVIPKDCWAFYDQLVYK